MLTIKVISNYGGGHIVEAISATIVPPDPGSSDHPHLVYVDANTKEYEFIKYPCDAFVMNENGKTIMIFRNMYPLTSVEKEKPHEL